ncbi:hypothetical protein RhiJN_08236 [Ceratobasidium sp. AG-Ba]|nr:hypothetical protein RhiJN_08236 [Ceratobasidium sp. AG-Ba]
MQTSDAPVAGLPWHSPKRWCPTPTRVPPGLLSHPAQPVHQCPEPDPSMSVQVTPGLRVLGDQYSVLCIKLIAINVQVLMVSDFGCLDEFIENTRSVSDLHFALANITAWTLYKISTSDSPDASLVKQLGGIAQLIELSESIDDTVTLVDCLYQERDRLLLSRCSSPQFWCGVSLMLCPAWAYIMVNRDSRHTLNMAPQLGDLLFRFASAEFISQDEELMTGYMASNIHSVFGEDSPGNEFYVGSAGQRDSQLIVQTVSSKFVAGHPPLVLVHELQKWAGRSIDSSRRPDLMLQLIEATLVRFWRSLGREQQKIIAKCESVIQILYVTSSLFIHFTEVLEPKDLTLVPQTMRNMMVATATIQNDFISLLARVTTIAYASDRQSFTTHHQLWLDRDLGHHSNFMARFSLQLEKFWPSKRQQSDESYIDWLKAAQLLDESLSSLVDSKGIHDHVGTQGARTPRLLADRFLPVDAAEWLRIAATLVSMLLKITMSILLFDRPIDIGLRTYLEVRMR